MIRDDVKTVQIAAMKGGDKPTVATTRLILSSLKNRDIELRTGAGPADDDLVVTEVLQKMIKQRRESIELFRKGGREELATAEEGEVAVIERFLPRQMDDADATHAIEAVAAELGASTIKDMGRVMAEVKSRFAGKMDMARASALVKARLAG